MKDVINNISNIFIEEAKSSPRMLEDLAAMEKYLSESYDGRTFVELIQNADDANSSRVSVDYVNNVLIVANDGRNFDENDIMSICRSGASNKQRGKNIGYRGVGFKSATTISTEIIIYSSNTFFTFSKTLCARTLGLNEEKVPTVRIPFIYDESELDSKVLSKIEELESEGFTTFFIFKDAKINKFKEELNGFDSGWLLFLNKVSNVRINLPLQNIVSKVHRKKHNDDTIVKIVGEKEQWYITENKGTAIAFRYDEDEVIACSLEESVFHCFLPTLDKTGFPFKVNADFSTDPSRKHIIVDDITESSLDMIGDLFVSFVIKATENHEIRLLNALNLINTHTYLGDLVSRLEKNIEDRFRNNAWVLNKAGKMTSAQNITYFPKWLESDERQQIISAFPYIANNCYDDIVYEGIERINNMLTKYGSKEIAYDVLINQIKGPDTSKALGVSIASKIFVYCGRRIINEKDKTDELFVPTNSGYIQLGEIGDSAELDSIFIGIITSVFNNKEKSILANNYKVFSLFNGNKTGSSGIKSQSVSQQVKKDNLTVNKWKTPIQNCIAVEGLEGRAAKDVSRKNDSYACICTNCGRSFALLQDTDRKIKIEQTKLIC